MQHLLLTCCKTLSDFNAANYIFRSQKQPELAISRCQVFRIIKKAAQACGLEQHISCHSLRKTFGYFSLRSKELCTLIFNFP